MNNQEFAHIFHNQILACEDKLVSKSKEYADDEDRLHNFRVAAVVKDETMQQALAGMMVKHTTSVYDMCKSEEDFSLDLWNEKITDHINYLILLKAVVLESAMDQAQATFNFEPSPAKHLNF